MKSKFYLGLVAVVIAIALSSCNKAPQAEIEAAKAALSEAQITGADTYLPEEYMAVNDSLDAALSNIETKKSKWFANYNAEKEQLNNITTLANTLKQNAEIRKEEIKNEVMTSLAELRSILDENQQLLTQAPKGKEGAAALVAINDELNLLNTSVAEVMAMVEKGDYLSAQTKTATINEKAMAINVELKEAIAKATKKPRG